MVTERTLEDRAFDYQQGDRKAFRLLVESLTRPLIAFAYRYTKDWETARDLTQETWLKVHRKIGGYDPARPLRGWLYTIHRNTCLSYLRSAAVRHETPMPEDGYAPGADEDYTDVQTLIEHREFFERLSKALTELGEKQRDVFVKVDIEQIDQREAAAILKMSFSTLRTTLHFARRRLAGILRKLEETP